MILLPLFKGLSDPVRLRITHLLTQRDKLCVCDITDALSLPQSTVSRHLNTLKHCGLVDAERKGKWVYYSMIKTADIAVISELIRNGSLSDGQLQQDLAMLKKSIC
ncbi:MAG: metalloregulator ArsR/SmtB family transcription factor [Mariprofundus sp.]|nr:metalloregulator ArsR/SmtB family transcription factor [Mariprofundus sp.]